MRILIFLFAISMAISFVGNISIFSLFTNQAVLAQPKKEKDKNNATKEETSNDNIIPEAKDMPRMPKPPEESGSGSKPGSKPGSEPNKP